MIDFSKIYEGWRNHLLPPSYLKEAIKKVSQERMDICEHCYYHSKFHPSFRPDAHCTECSCTLSAKTKCLSCSCPLSPPKWEAVVTEEEEVIMTENETEEFSPD
jgi:hypothetical protein